MHGASPRAPRALSLLVLTLSVLAAVPRAQAQEEYDPSWYDPTAPYVKVGVVADGVHALSGSALSAAGVDLGAIVPSTLRLLKNGEEIPIWTSAPAGGPMTAADRVEFVGRRNTGEDERWAYSDPLYEVGGGTDSLQSSAHRSLFSDTTWYWLTWGGAAGLRYEDRDPAPAPGATPIGAVRQVVHVEDDYNGMYYQGDGNLNSAHPYYTRGEGRYMRLFNQRGVVRDSIVIGLPVGYQTYNSTDSVRFTVRINGGSAARHLVHFRVRRQLPGAPYITAVTADWTGYGYQTLRAAFAQTEVFAYEYLYYIEIVADNFFWDGITNNLVQMDWVEVDFERALRAIGGELSFETPPPGTYAYNLSGLEPNRALTVYAPELGRRFTGTATATGTFALGDAPDREATYWLVKADSLRAPAAVLRDRSSDLASPANAAEYLVVATPDTRASAEALASFHAARDGYTTAVVDVHDIFDQFDYGRPTPIALRRFFQHTRAWDTPPRFFLLWGDARYADPGRPLASWEVPSYGFASSDAWLVQGLNGWDDRTEFAAIGRVTVRTNADGQLFLQKLQGYYDTPPEDWPQRAYYLTGGDPAEQAGFQMASRNWARAAAGDPAGMDTTFFFKTARTILDNTLRDSLRVAIRRGSSLLSYFGHSSARTWEIVVDPASEFDNADRLPVVLSFGCRTGAFAGDIISGQDTPSLAEDLLLSAPSGAIAHWGATELSTGSDSQTLGDTLHAALFRDSLRVLGEVFQEVKTRYAQQHAANPNQHWGIRHALQYNLIGDPGMRMIIPDKPDLRFVASNVRFSPLAPLTADSTVHVEAVLVNRGMYPADSVDVHLTHAAPDGATALFTQRVARFALRDTLDFDIPTLGQAGTHSFTLAADPLNDFEELNEADNAVTLTHVVFSNGLTAVHPEPLGITDLQPRLRVSIASQIGLPDAPVLFQLDTTAAFDSPALQTHTAPLADLHADWVPGALRNEQVYYWRARLNDPEEPDTAWTQSAFTAAPQETNYTWTQRGSLFLQNEDNVRLAWADGAWSFVPYEVSVFASATRGGGFYAAQFLVNGQVYLRNDFGYGLIRVNGNLGTLEAAEAFVTYPNIRGVDHVFHTARLQAAVAAIPEGDYFFFRTYHVERQPGVVEIPEVVKDVFRDLGSTAIDTLTYDHQWLFRGRRGDPTSLEEWVVAPSDTTNEIFWTSKLSFSFPEGETTSPPIGPARVWGALSANLGLENSAASILVDVLSADGTELLLDDVDLRAGPADLSGISADEHPSLRLRAFFSDTTQASTPQLHSWRIAYTPIPEIVVDGEASTFPDSTVQEGAPYPFGIVVRNLSFFPADSIHVAVRATGADNEEYVVDEGGLPALGADAAATINLDFNTLDRVGDNLFFVEAEQTDVAERTTYNNLFFHEVEVTPDRTRPVLTVTVEGLSLENDPERVVDLQDPALPFVSATPRIEIVASDENPYLRLTDPATFELTLDGEVVPPEAYTFTGATEEHNEARIVFEPDLSGRDTVHTLTVRAFDASGNPALVDATAEDSTRYQVHFRVQDDVQVESLYPYPNPMPGNTRFLFRLRGAEASLVEDFRIRLYTINGRLVREFDLLRSPELTEAGGLRIGWNAVPWDGLDEDGDPVGSGVYLYRVFARSEGQELVVNNETNIEKVVVIR
ncbi:MAG TPA: C25 family cysteine peptidase [Rubricoccaceae bacterium]|nr:C25 family cysteine peptidase [Rubricoccaceae bacterium]